MKRIVLVLALAALSSCISCNKPESTKVSNGDPADLTSNVEYYNFAPTIKESPIYAVKAAGEFITVVPTIEPHLAWLGIDEGTVRIDIALQSGVVKDVAVRPLAKKHNYRIENGRLILFLKKYDRVSVEINGDIKNPLFLFVNPIDSERPSKTDPSVKYFEAGQIYEINNYVLKEDCKEVYFEPGCYVKGNILAADLENVKIHGGGFLDSTGKEGRFGEFYQPFSIALTRCPSASLSDYTHLFTAGGWCSLYTNCSNSTITNVKSISTETAPGVKTNNDSMDIIGGKNVRVKYGFLYGHDDCYCLKSQKFHLKGEVDGIYYEDCIGWNVDAGNTFEIGYETQIDITNVNYKNCYSIHSGTSGNDMRRAAFSIHNGGAGTISNVNYENVFIEDAMEFGIYLSILSHNYNFGYDDQGLPLVYSPGFIKDVTYKNIQVLAVRPNKGKCVISGYDADHKISNVCFNDFVYLGDKASSLNETFWSVKRNFEDITFN